MTTEVFWLAMGFLGQALFSARFLVQWLASERQGKSIIPELFWYFSLAGGAVLFSYALYRADPVFLLGQSFGLIVYSRNIYLLAQEKRRERLSAAVNLEQEG